jgi:hypothetical protein
MGSGLGVKSHQSKTPRRKTVALYFGIQVVLELTKSFVFGQKFVGSV